MVRFSLMSLAVLLVVASSALAVNLAPPNPPRIQQFGKYVIIGWNDLGMHCINPRYKDLCLLPPYNNICATVIQRGEEPTIITRGVNIAYSLDGNTTTKYKTDFWAYAPQLFGPVPWGTGLTGNKLAGRMTPAGGIFEATGVPVLPRLDTGRWLPYQQATLRMTSAGNGAHLGTTSVVVPVSDEMHCDKCHANGKIAAKNIVTASVDTNILTLHDRKHGTKLMNNRPVLCANCHNDPALGKDGKQGIESLSLAMHGHHSWLRNQPTCYDCHPGVTTQCNRSSLPGMGPTASGPNCEDCHGDLKHLAAGLVAGRKPWIQEPTCAQCHGAGYSTGKVLYRNATGHGGVRCVACHNSPHAWYPSVRAQDNAQPLALQGNNRAIGYNGCNVCHTDGRTGQMPPHGDDDEQDARIRDKTGT